MHKNQFERRFQAFQIPREELERMYRREMEIQEQMKMMAEAAFQQNMQSASGVGAPQTSSSPEPPSPVLIGDLTSLIYWQDTTSGTWKFIVHDYNTNETTEEYDTELDYTDYTSVSNDEIVEQGGYMISFADNGNSLRTFFFVSALGDVLERVDSNSLINEEFNTFEFLATYCFYDTGAEVLLYLFDGTTVQQFSFPTGVSISRNSGGGEITSGRSVAFTVNDGGTERTYIFPGGGQQIDVTATSGDSNNYQWTTSFQSDFMICLKQDPGTSVFNEIVVFDESGTVRNTFDLSSFDCTDLWTQRPYGNNHYAAIFYNNGDSGVDWHVIKYDSDTDTFYTETQERANFTDVGFYFDYRETVDDFPNDTPNLVVYFQDNTGFGNWGQQNYYQSVIWSIGNGALQKHVFTNGGTQYEFFFNSNMYSDIPLLPFAEVGATGNIELAILKADGIDFGISAQPNASCTEVQGYNLVDKTLFIFIDAPNAIFEFWSDSLEQTRTISNAPYIYTNGGSVAVFDSNDLSESFFYTSSTNLIGVMPELTDHGGSPNMNYGTLTGVEDGSVVFWQNNAQGNAFEDAYVLNPDGTLIGPITGENTPSGGVTLGRTTFSWGYESIDDTPQRVLVQYSLSDGSVNSTIYTGFSGLDDTDVYSDRVFARKTDSGTTTVFLIGPGGSKTITKTTSFLRVSHNDAYWAD